MRKILVVFFIAAGAPVTNAAGVRVLIPIYFEQTISGAFGSVWQARFAVHNSSQCAYHIAWCSPPATDVACPLDLRFDEQLHPNEKQTALPGRYPKPVNGAAGAVVYLGKEAFPVQDCAAADDSKDLSFQLRVTDVSRSATNAGTEVPVVRESSFRTSTLHILDVPSESRFRLALRLFEMNLDRADFAIRVFDQTTTALVSERRVTTSTPPQGTMRFQPGFTEIVDLTPAPGTAPQPAYVRVEIEPLTPGAAFWSYVSVTNNESQQVTLVTPQ